MYTGGATWWLENAEVIQEAMEEQSARFEADVWQDQIESWLKISTERWDDQSSSGVKFTSSPDSVTVPDILLQCIGKRPDQWIQADKMRVARSLKNLGWQRYRGGPKANRQWRYRKTEEVSQPQASVPGGVPGGVPG
jgi:hypothetical protein